MSLLANSNAIESGGYNIDRSLRFRSSASAYLSRTLTTPTNNHVFTISMWVKRGAINGTYQNLFSLQSLGQVMRFDTSEVLYFSPTSTASFTTTRVFRDASAWYHILISVNTDAATSTDRMKLYINGTQETAFSSVTYPTLNQACGYNSALAHAIGSYTPGGQYFDGYLAEVNFIDGQALTPSSFGQTDAVTGVWVPKKYTGTYGTNGFYLPFSDNTSATTLAYDKSGNGNNWTANNISTTAGATYDSMTDVPTLTSATAANYCVLNPLDIYSTVPTNGNLSYASANGRCRSTFSIPTSGKWYWEVTATASRFYSGVVSTTAVLSSSAALANNSGAGYYTLERESTINNFYNASTTGTSVGSASISTNDVMCFAYDAANRYLWIGYGNGSGSPTWYSSGNPSGGTNQLATLADNNYSAFCYDNSSLYSTAFNFGQRPFSYTPPTGFKALNTFNLPDPTIKKPNQYMDAVTYTGDGTANRVISGLNLTPDFVWIKNRSSTWDNILGNYNVVNASQQPITLVSNSTGAEVDGGYIGTQTSNSLKLAQSANENRTNGSALTYVSWLWKKGATPGFDIVTYTGNGGTQNISHSLGVAPKMIVVKSRSATGDWPVYHASTGNGGITWLNQTSAFSSGSAWNSTSPTSSQFTVGNNVNTNVNGVNYVAYLFAEIAGFSKFGSYTGNGSTDGPFVYCGFRPKYVLIKSSSVATTDWYVQDATVNPSNVVTKYLYPNLSSAEQTNGLIDFTSNGFKIRNSYAPENQNGATYIYACFAENPFKYSNAR